MELIKQPNSWSCWAAVCCMITGETIDDFVKYVGHDGSAIEEHSKHPDKRAGFWDHEALQYLASRRYFAFANLPREFADHIDEEGRVHIVFMPSDKEQIFAVQVKSNNFNGCTHIIAYYDGKVYDPSPNCSYVKLSQYEINAIYPIRKI